MEYNYSYSRPNVKVGTVVLPTNPSVLSPFLKRRIITLKS